MSGRRVRQIRAAFVARTGRGASPAQTRRLKKNHALVRNGLPPIPYVHTQRIHQEFWQ